MANLKAAFEKAVAFVLEQEGGWVDDPSDSGGETNFGISSPVLEKATFLGLVPKGTTPRTLTRAEAIGIYQDLYWNKIHGDELPPAVAFHLFDSAVNQGPETATRLLQQTLGVEPDGIVGEETVRAAKDQVGARLLDEFVSKRLLRYVRTKNVERFAYGWIRRAVATHRRALGLLWGVA